MTTAADGNTVKVHYTGSLDDGSVFDSSEGRDPLQFTVGAGQVIQGFDKAVTGLAVGDTNEVTFEPEEGYGPHRPEMVFDVPREQFPQDVTPEVGMRLAAQGPGGQPLELVIVELGEETIKVDANHALAGKRLTFKVELVEIVS